METEQTDEQPTLDGLRREIEELRASRKRLALVADAERRGIERALHEGVLQDLVGLAANLEVAAGSVDSDPAAAKTILDELQREARRALTETQELATRVFPPLLDVGGLVAELRGAASRAGVRARIDVDIDVVMTLRRRSSAPSTSARSTCSSARRRARRWWSASEASRACSRSRSSRSVTWERSAALRTIASMRWAGTSRSRRRAAGPTWPAPCHSQDDANRSLRGTRSRP